MGRNRGVRRFILGGATEFFGGALARVIAVRTGRRRTPDGTGIFWGRNRASARAPATETCTAVALTLAPGTPLGQGLESSGKIFLARVGAVLEASRPRPLELLWTTSPVINNSRLLFFNRRHKRNPLLRSPSLVPFDTRRVVDFEEISWKDEFSGINNSRLLFFNRRDEIT